MRYYFTGLVAFILLSTNSIAQNTYENGYFIDKDGVRKECLILNKDWMNNPQKISYKLSAEGAEQSLTPADAREFGVAELKYVSARVKIDRASDEPSKLSSQRNPDFQTEHLFLKVMMEGKASLMHYFDKGIERFFYSTEANDSIRQLVYKRYLVTGSSAKANNTYMNQLALDLACGDLAKTVERLRYTSSSIRAYFLKYNECMGVTVTETSKRDRRTKIHLAVTPGLDMTKFKVSPVDANFAEKGYADEKSVRIGLEAEFELPFNNRKWSLLVEPTYQRYTTTKPFKVNYSSLEIPAGVRHYFYLNEQARIFVNAAAVFDIPAELEVQYAKNGPMREGSSTPTVSFAAGAGVKYRRYGLEARYYGDRDRLDYSGGSFLVSRKVSIIASFRIF